MRTPVPLADIRAIPLRKGFWRTSSKTIFLPFGDQSGCSALTACVICLAPDPSGRMVKIWKCWGLSCAYAISPFLPGVVARPPEARLPTAAMMTATPPIGARTRLTVDSSFLRRRSPHADAGQTRLRIGFSFRRSTAFADRRYEWRAAGETGLATVFAPCLHGDRPRATGASHNALHRVVCDDRRMRPTVLIVDDHEAFRESASALLEAEGFAVLGEAADGGTAIVESERLRPDVVLLDIQLPDLDGFTVAERLAAAREPPAVVLISSREAEAYGPRLDAAAAQGFISKRELSGAALAALIS